ncbi:MAG: hypothetical protein MJ252_16160 [archaeon]|nr:hypothetical protein [archaeon]
MDHKKQSSCVHTINSMRNSVSVVGGKREFLNKFGNKLKSQNLSINVLSFSQNKDNM